MYINFKKENREYLENNNSNDKVKNNRTNQNENAYGNYAKCFSTALLLNLSPLQNNYYDMNENNMVDKLNNSYSAKNGENSYLLNDFLTSDLIQKIDQLSPVSVTNNNKGNISDVSLNSNDEDEGHKNNNKKYFNSSSDEYELQEDENSNDNPTNKQKKTNHKLTRKIMKDNLLNKTFYSFKINRKKYFDYEAKKRKRNKSINYKNSELVQKYVNEVVKENDNVFNNNCVIQKFSKRKGSLIDDQTFENTNDNFNFNFLPNEELLGENNCQFWGGNENLYPDNLNNYNNNNLHSNNHYNNYQQMKNTQESNYISNNNYHKYPINNDYNFKNEYNNNNIPSNINNLFKTKLNLNHITPYNPKSNKFNRKPIMNYELYQEDMNNIDYNNPNNQLGNINMNMNDDFLNNNKKLKQMKIKNNRRLQIQLSLEEINEKKMTAADVNQPEEYLIEMFGRVGWICNQCNNFNYETRNKCNRCGIVKLPKKINDIKKKKDKNEKDKRKSKDHKGDWICPQCFNLNFGFRKVCNRCQIPRDTVSNYENKMNVNMNLMDNYKNFNNLNKEIYTSFPPNFDNQMLYDNNGRYNKNFKNCPPLE